MSCDLLMRLIQSNFIDHWHCAKYLHAEMGRTVYASDDDWNFQWVKLIDGEVIVDQDFLLHFFQIAFSAGLATRFALHNNPRSTTIYVVQSLLVVLSVSIARVLASQETVHSSSHLSSSHVHLLQQTTFS